MLSQAQFEEGLLFLLLVGYIAKLVVQEAAEEFYVAFLRVDRQSFAVLGARSVIVINSSRVGLENAQIDEERADHHSSSALASLTVDNDHGLLWHWFLLRLIV